VFKEQHDRRSKENGLPMQDGNRLPNISLNSELAKGFDHIATPPRIPEADYRNSQEISRPARPSGRSRNRSLTLAAGFPDTLLSVNEKNFRRRFIKICRFVSTNRRFHGRIMQAGYKRQAAIQTLWSGLWVMFVA
jgi:hypothetical protein